MNDLKLYMLLIGCTPPGRHTEQHDVFFCIGTSLKELIPDIINFWPEGEGRIHIDGWREVNSVDGYEIKVIYRAEGNASKERQLFFINLGGYKEGVFDEPHFKFITVQPDKAAAIKYAKGTWFYEHVHFPGATSHIDDKFGVDVDDIYEIDEILPAAQRELYQLSIIKNDAIAADELHLGYFKLSSL